MTTPVCAVCGRPMFLQAERDHVGRPTSRGRWTHYDAKRDADHAARPEVKR
jgi:hypothetical protein